MCSRNYSKWQPEVLARSCNYSKWQRSVWLKSLYVVFHPDNYRKSLTTIYDTGTVDYFKTTLIYSRFQSMGQGRSWPVWVPLRQWRNSYGLRVGKPAGTRAEGAPRGPLDFRVPAKIAPEIAFYWWNQKYLATSAEGEEPGGGHWPRKGVWGCAALNKASELVPCSLLPHWNSMRFFATVSLTDLMGTYMDSWLARFCILVNACHRKSLGSHFTPVKNIGSTHWLLHTSVHEMQQVTGF